MIDRLEIALLAFGFATMTIADLNLAKHGVRGRIYLSDRQKAFFDTDRDRAYSQELVSSLQLWLPIFGILASVSLWQTTVDRMIRLALPDLVLAVLYASAFVALFYGPCSVLQFIATRYEAHLRKTGDPASRTTTSESQRQSTETDWLILLAAAFVATGMAFCSLVGFPWIFGSLAGLVLLHQRLQYRRRHLDRCRLAEKLES